MRRRFNLDADNDLLYRGGWICLWPSAARFLSDHVVEGGQVWVSDKVMPRAYRFDRTISRDSDLMPSHLWQHGDVLNEDATIWVRFK